MLDIYFINLLFQSEIRMVLIGRTGSGISASGNSILKQACFQSDSSGSSVTKTCCIGTTERGGKIIKVVDTPGLFGNIMTVDEIRCEILNCFTLISPGPHVIVYVLRIGRFTDEEIQGVKRFLQVFGGNPLHYTIILFTGVDDLEWDQTSNEEYLKNAPSYLKELVKACCRRFVFFNNRLSSSVESDFQLDDFFETVEKMLEVNKKRIPYYTYQICTHINEDAHYDGVLKQEKDVCNRQSRQISGGIALVAGCFAVALTGNPIPAVVGLGTGITAITYFSDVKETNDALNTVLDEIKKNDSTRLCTIS